MTATDRPSPGSGSPREPDKSPGSRLRLAAAALFLVSGAAGLVYEVAWARLLVRIVGGAYPAAAAVAASFLGGLALGAWLGARRAVRTDRPLRLYAWLEGGIAAWALLFPLLLAAAHPVHGWCYRTFGGDPSLHMAANLVVAAALLLPPTIAMGATLPVLLRGLQSGGGTVLGGTVMHWIDLAAAIVANRHSRRPVVTAAFDEMSFLAPIQVGQLAVIDACITLVDRSSMEIRVRVESEDLLTGERRHTSTAYVTFVALDPVTKRPAPVPPLVLEADDERAEHTRALERRQLRLERRKRESRS